MPFRAPQSGRGRLVFFTQSQRDDGAKTISPHPPNGGREAPYDTGFKNIPLSIQYGSEKKNSASNIVQRSNFYCEVINVPLIYRQTGRTRFPGIDTATLLMNNNC
jgi:hypothetical protein